MSLYISQPIDVDITCYLDDELLDSGVSAVINYQKPNKTEGSWAASLDIVTGVVSYSATAEEIDRAGIWKLQPVVNFGSGNEIPGTTVDMEILARFK